MESPRVYICLDGKSRSVELSEYASGQGREARYVEGGRRRFNTLTVSAIQSDIAEDEIVFIVREPKSRRWADDWESAEQTQTLLAKASRRYRTGSFVDLFAELVDAR